MILYILWITEETMGIKNSEIKIVSTCSWLAKSRRKNIRRSADKQKLVLTDNNLYIVQKLNSSIQRIKHHATE